MQRVRISKFLGEKRSRVKVAIYRWRERIRLIELKFKPVWEGVFENYAKKKTSENLWRFQSLGHTFEDILNECWIVFEICRKKYANITCIKHFMALFKTSIFNFFIDLANKNSNERCIQLEDEYQQGATVGDAGALLVHFARAPQELRDYLDSVLGESSKSIVSVNKKLSYAYKCFCKKIGVNPTTTSIAKVFRRYCETNSITTY